MCIFLHMKYTSQITLISRPLSSLSYEGFSEKKPACDVIFTLNISGNNAEYTLTDLQKSYVVPISTVLCGTKVKPCTGGATMAQAHY